MDRKFLYQMLERQFLHHGTSYGNEMDFLLDLSWHRILVRTPELTEEFKLEDMPKDLLKAIKKRVIDESKWIDHFITGKKIKN